ncbi:MAG: hypothetical protein WBK51_14065 [Polaromonas sp.]
MSQILNQLATIQVSEENVHDLALDDIYRTFRDNLGKLNNLKNFRAGFEKQNALKRWWFKDDLHNAQLDAVQIQSEFSKTIGQLVMLSIMKSKRLSEQQGQLNHQQHELKAQADGIAQHALELQHQHRVLAEQSETLKTVVDDYFKSKGLTDEDVQKLINIVSEVKTTKDTMLSEFAARTENVELLCKDMTAQMKFVWSKADDQLSTNSEYVRSSIQALQKENKLELDNYTAKQIERDDFYQSKINSISDGLNAQAMLVSETCNSISTQKNEMTAFAQQMQKHQTQQDSLEKWASGRLQGLRIFVAFSSVVGPILVLSIARLFKWI